MATSWAAQLTNDGSGNYTVAVRRNGSIASGSAYTAPTGESAAANTIHIALSRIRRWIMAGIQAGTISETADNIAFNIANSAGATDAFTPTLRYGAAAASGGTVITAPLNEVSAVFRHSAIVQAMNRILNDIGAGN